MTLPKELLEKIDPDARDLFVILDQRLTDLEDAVGSDADPLVDKTYELNEAFGNLIGSEVDRDLQVADVDAVIAFIDGLIAEKVADIPEGTFDA